jgi:hypothetical protein
MRATDTQERGILRYKHDAQASEYTSTRREPYTEGESVKVEFSGC